MAESGAGGHVDVSVDGHVAVVTMRRGENRFNTTFFKQINDALDRVENNPDVKVLITTGENKFYSNGIDLEWRANAVKENPMMQTHFADAMRSLNQRILTFPAITVAAINGHVFAGGAILASCHDYRFMNGEKGWFSLNEVHLKMLLSPYLLLLLEMRLSSPVFAEAVITGRRYTASQALQRGIVQGISGKGESVVTTAKTFLKTLSPGPPEDTGFLKTMKTALYLPVLETPDQSLPTLAQSKM